MPNHSGFRCSPSRLLLLETRQVAFASPNLPLHRAVRQNSHMDTPGVWFLALRTGSGAGVFAQRLADALGRLGVRGEITWLRFDLA